ncbi:hypothetical protein DR950_03730 [Kitasatospora xanthocidica]|uniref:Uncharacterized protein n=1 Tax=Kitasatospora xanthocidica TaxID=83382 RepID=A0A372ZMS6_9ACTN|nr:hypothetical protein DR950_03730 [Kitasatospora xanthocidica]
MRRPRGWAGRRRPTRRPRRRGRPRASRTGTRRRGGRRPRRAPAGGRAAWAAEPSGSSEPGGCRPPPWRGRTRRSGSDRCARRRSPR